MGVVPAGKGELRLLLFRSPGIDVPTLYEKPYMTGSAWNWIRRLGGPGLILLGIFDNTPFISAPPGSMDVFVILLSAGRPEWWPWYALMATIGEVLGGYLTYRLAEKAVRRPWKESSGDHAPRNYTDSSRKAGS
jgi:membrane protein YqaA with SNARE-associated domain